MNYLLCKFFRGLRLKSSPYGLHIWPYACYKGRNNKKQKSDLELILKNYPSSGCTLKLKYIKVESSVIADNNAAVNAQSNFAHTAHHARRVVKARKVQT